MTSANKFKLSIAEQSALGVAASSGFITQLVTGEGFNPDPTFETSQRITGRRAHTDHILTSVNPSGNLDFECAFNDLLVPLKGVTFAGGREYPHARGATLTGVTAATNTFATPGVTFAPGMICRSAGFDDAGNNQKFVAQAGSGADAVVAPAGLADDASPAAGASVRAMGFEGADIVATADGLQSAADVDFTAMQLTPGQGVKTAGFAIAGMNARVEVEEVLDAQNLRLKNLPSAWAAGAATTGNVQGYTGDIKEYADDPLYHTVQKHYGADAEGIVVEDVIFDQMALQFNAGGRLTANAQVKGTLGNVRTLIEANPTEVEISPVMSAARSIARVCEGGATVGRAYLPDQLTVTIRNNTGDITGLGYDGPADFSEGDHELMIDWRFRHGGFDVFRKLVEETETSCLIPFDRGGQGFILTVPVLTYTAGNANVAGRNQEIYDPMQLMAKEDGNGRLYTLTVLHEFL